jgi:flagellar motor switch protein FliN
LSDPHTDEARIRPWLTGEFVSGLTQALEGMSGDPPTLTVDPEPGPLAEGQLAWQQPLSTGPSAWLAAAEAVWAEIGDLTLRAAGIEDSDAATARSTFVEILGQAFSVLARGIGKRLQGEVTCGAGQESTAPPALNWTSLTVVIGNAPPKQLSIAFDDALIHELVEAETAQAAATEDSGKAASPDHAAGMHQPPITASRTLELLLDVELPVSVSFGRAQLPLKDVIKLTTGSIVELNRTIVEPVEVIVNNCVIAMGEVVVVEGNFGVRIQQVISRQERLRTLY